MFLVFRTNRVDEFFLTAETEDLLKAKLEAYMKEDTKEYEGVFTKNYVFNLINTGRCSSGIFYDLEVRYNVVEENCSYPSKTTFTVLKIL